jgi:Fe-S-cluster containining protein
VNELKVPFWKFVCRWADPSCAISRGVAPHFFFDDDRQTPYVIGLRQTESRLFRGTRKCVFLEETDPAGRLERGTGRCSVYEHRPSACRIFPARVDEAGALDALAVRECSDDIEHEVYELCPRRWSVSDLDPVAAVEDLRACASEMELFHAIAQRWNDQPGPWPFFPDFLELIYTALAAA